MRYVIVRNPRHVRRDMGRKLVDVLFRQQVSRLEQPRANVPVDKSLLSQVIRRVK